MVSVVYSALLHCLEGFVVQVEADISDGMPGMELVGLLGSEVKEARERVRMALKNSGFSMPLRRITLNLSPANIRKNGTGFDLAMAVAILLSMDRIRENAVESSVFFGELNLSGAVCPINGVLPLVLCAAKAGFMKCYVPLDNAQEAAMIDGMQVYPVSSLTQLFLHLNGEEEIACVRKIQAEDARVIYTHDLKYVQGQTFARRGLEIAASGMHNILMVGEPGAGKSMLSKCLPSILPPLTNEESLEVSSIYSVAGKLGESGGLLRERPFVSPHHTVTDVALTGGGLRPKAGLIALAHKGVLFLDEMPEFKRSSLEILRQPMEDRKILISRSGGSYEYPADFMLVGAMNPCPCGAFPDRTRCRCTDTQIRQYLDRLSKPLMDRIDISIEVENLPFSDLRGSAEQEDSETVRDRVMQVHRIQFQRFGKAFFNSQMQQAEIEKFCALDAACNAIMEKAYSSYRLSARGYHRILKVARTIADMDMADRIREAHLIEALRYRCADSRDYLGR
ncbi:MAG: YifB family Mg chelatase-like AAA ATPase [Lachnospiraceae bacterium]|nr:YifB family Mg chelatase-like AAA ATPase [Lachnospiraceae bacterium]